ncbi:alpha/beta hydrolase [Urechidicola vernalis]|uniref:Alpha/beta hydrolase n=1 Tax=Urechidicola vernalis TaxID=3075600 RepID=A0ABU2Y0X9_9FLAO|nr:alpha/beta hydrolase [Urechidicola sp. P050]MDT0551841.1 alpha/beta hydrolase [Urechidicola sp. P050]
MKNSLVLFLVFAALIRSFASVEPNLKVVYKEVDGIKLSMDIFFPENHKMNNQSPAILFFHGGGWKGGGVAHFYNQAAYLASRGMVAISVQYRTEKPHGTTPIECVKDGKSAMRWIKTHASEYGIDPNRIVAGGGSAGGHVAAAMATLEGFNEEGEDTSVSCVPKALVLFNPVANNGPNGYGFERVHEYWEGFSPAHNLIKNAPPTLIMLGTKDKLFTVSQAQEYKQKMEVLGLRCDLILYDDQDHAFFNIDMNKELHFKTMEDADVFLTSLGYLKGKPIVNKFRESINEK